jgi:hypothetical protein
MMPVWSPSDLPGCASGSDGSRMDVVCGDLADPLAYPLSEIAGPTARMRLNSSASSASSARPFVSVSLSARRLLARQPLGCHGFEKPSLPFPSGHLCRVLDAADSCQAVGHGHAAPQTRHLRAERPPSFGPPLRTVIEH